MHPLCGPFNTLVLRAFRSPWTYKLLALLLVAIVLKLKYPHRTPPKIIFSGTKN